MTNPHAEPLVDPHDTDWNLLSRALSGVASPAEEAELRRWLSADPERERMFDDLRSVWAAPLRPLRRYDAEAAWERLRARLRIADGRAELRAAGRSDRPAVRVHGGRLTRPARLLLRVAAVLAVTLIPTLGRRMPSERARVAMAPAAIDVVAARGQRRAFRLPDGSRVVLAAGSALRYPAAFDGDIRAVQLRGLAHFEVTHDSARPFVVRTRGSTTRVLGTRFVVRAYREEAAVEVAVAEGRVALAAATSGGPEIFLGGGQVGRVRGTEPSRIPSVGGLDPYFGWTAGRLVIRDRTLTETFAELERWYDVDLELARGFAADRLVTTTIEDEPLAAVLERIALALDAQYVPEGDTIAFLPRTR